MSFPLEMTRDSGSGPVSLEIGPLERRYAPLRVCDAGRQNRLAASMLAHGQQTPVLVVPGAAGRYVLIDGYARVAALESMSRDLVDALVLSGTETQALVLAYRMETGRRRTALEEAWLLRELVEVHGENATTLAVSLQRSASWISRRLALVRVLPESAQSAVRRGQLPAQAAMKSLVPLARANRTQCEDLVTHLEGRVISVRQMESLYQGWKAGDTEQRARLTERPWLFLKAKDQVTNAPMEEASEGSRLVTMVETLVGLSCQVRRWIRGGAWHRTNEIERRNFRGRCRELELVWAEIDQLTHEEKGHARSRHARRDPASDETGPRNPGDCTDSGSIEELGQTHPA